MKSIKSQNFKAGARLKGLFTFSSIFTFAMREVSFDL
jgi:hypothetical protein